MHSVNLTLVVGHRNVAEAGSLTALQVVEQAGAFQCALHRLDRNLAGAELKEALDRLHGCIH